MIQTSDPTHSAEMLRLMAIHLQHGLAYKLPLRGQKPSLIDSQRLEYVLAGIFDIGPVLAQRILIHFDVPYAVFRKSRTGPPDSNRLKSICNSLSEANWDIFVLFTIIDGCTIGKLGDRYCPWEAVSWFLGQLENVQASRFSQQDVDRIAHILLGN